MNILTVDVETSPHLSFHWRRWNENIPPEFTIAESRIISWAAKWYDKKKVMHRDIWQDGLDLFHEDLWNLLDEADVVVSYNGKKFDIKRINAEFLEHGMDPPSPFAQVDLFVQAKRHFNFSSNKLKHLLKRLGLTPKLEDGVDMQLWIDCVYKEDWNAQKLMKKYNIQDVKSTEALYEYMLGWLDQHPNWGVYVEDVTSDTPVCPNCGGTHLVKHKVRRTTTRVYQQYQCQDCGKYSRGRKNIGTKGVDNGILI